MNRRYRAALGLAAVAYAVATRSSAQTPASTKPRARDLGLPIGGTAGPLDAITDVGGVEVGHTTLISGSGKLVVGKGPIRTGVTVIHPRGKTNPDPVFGAWFTLNGNGEMTGTTWLQESGILEGPIAITNTHSVGVVRDAILQWQVGKPGMQPWGLPVVVFIACLFIVGEALDPAGVTSWVGQQVIDRGGHKRTPLIVTVGRMCHSSCT